MDYKNSQPGLSGTVEDHERVMKESAKAGLLTPEGLRNLRARVIGAYGLPGLSPPTPEQLAATEAAEAALELRSNPPGFTSTPDVGGWLNPSEKNQYAGLWGHRKLARSTTTVKNT